MRRVKTARRIFEFFRAHPRVLIAAQLLILAVFFVSIGLAIRGSFRDASDDLRNADPVYFLLACAAVAAYYLVFVFGWIRILADWKIKISYPQALRAEMVSM